MAKWAAKQQMVEVFAGKPEPMGWYLEDEAGQYYRSPTRTEPDGTPAKWRAGSEAEAQAKADELNGGGDD